MCVFRPLEIIALFDYGIMHQMNSHLRTLLLGVLVAIAVLTLISAMRKERRHWNRSAWFVLGLGWVMSSAPAWGAWSRGRYISEDVFGNFQVRFVGLAAALSRYSWPLVGAGSLAMIFLAFKHHTRVSTAGLAFLGLWVAGVVSNGFNQLPIFTWGLFATGAAICAATVLPSGRGAILGAAVLGVSVAIVSIFLVIFRPEEAISGCRLGKCGPFGVLLFGAEGNENALGLILALALPFVAMAFSGRFRTLLVIFMALVVWATGSRSSLIAVVATLMVLVVCNPHIDERLRWRGRFKSFAVVVLIGGGAIGLGLPFVTSDLNAYSLRGEVWRVAREALPHSWILGSGADGWSTLRSTGRISAVSIYSTHNLWLDALFSAGFVGLMLALIGLSLLVRNGVFWVTILPLSAIFYAGIMERSWTVSTANWLVWVLPAMILTMGSSEGLPLVRKKINGGNVSS